jgi:hypothetical protein
VAAIIDELRLDRPVLVGWSYGAFVICDYIRAHGQERIAAVNFVEGAVKLGEAAFVTLIGPGFLDHFAGATADDLPTNIWAMRSFVKTCLVKPLPADDIEAAVCWNIVVPPQIRANLAAREIDDDDVLRGLDVPLLVTQGRADARRAHVSVRYSRRGFLTRAGAGAGAIALTGGSGALAPRAQAARSTTVVTSPTMFGRIFPHLPVFAPATERVKGRVPRARGPGGPLDAKDDLSKGPKLLITDLRLSVSEVLIGLIQSDPERVPGPKAQLETHPHLGGIGVPDEGLPRLRGRRPGDKACRESGLRLTSTSSSRVHAALRAAAVGCTSSSAASFRSATGAPSGRASSKPAVDRPRPRAAIASSRSIVTGGPPG